MIRNMSLVLALLIAFIVFAAAVLGDLDAAMVAAALPYIPWWLGGGALLVIVGVLIGTESPNWAHEQCLPERCDHKRVLMENEEIRQQVYLSHKEYNASHRRKVSV